MNTNTTTPVTEITYHWEGNVLIPDIGIPEEEAKLPSLTRWGLMHKDYLKNHRPIIYRSLLMSGKLFNHCMEIENQAEERFDFMMKQFAEHYKITEELKAADPIRWVQEMNGIKSQAEEIIKTELIYD